MRKGLERGTLAQLRHGTLPGGGKRVGGGGNSGETQNYGDCLDHFACVPFYPFSLASVRCAYDTLFLRYVKRNFSKRWIFL